MLCETHSRGNENVIAKTKMSFNDKPWKGVRNMAKNMKQTSRSVASKSSKILKDGRYGKDSKSVAGSALSQTKHGKKR